jgi:NAD(P)-dependent dehydrogenase (short-subunit alcohol dehydrogenase family)
MTAEEHDDRVVEERVCLITAASSGIGAGIARHVAAHGDRVVLMARSEKVLTFAEELGGTGLQGSIVKEKDIEAAVDMALHRYGRLDAVVNNSGHAPGSTTPTGRRYDPTVAGELLDITDAEWQQAFELFYLNVVRMARIVTPHFQNQGAGVIVNVSAFGERQPSAAYPASSTLRAAMAGFMKLYADRYARDGIRMNNVLPGYVDNWKWQPEVVDSIPMGRPARIEEIAQAVAFLLSDEASYITGQSLTVDGGFNR